MNSWHTRVRHALLPDWAAPANVHALMTTRVNAIDGSMGASRGVYGDVQGQKGFNLATHVGDAPDAVAHNRQLLRQILPSEPLWLNQTHGVAIARHSDAEVCPEADAVLLTERNQVGVIMTADCLPVLFTTRAGTMVAGAHAGWRSLVSGILEKTVAAMVQAGAANDEIVVWLGAAIGAEQFEVGAEVRKAFIEAGRALGISAEQTDACFVARSNDGNAPQKYLADIYALARQRLQCAGLHATQISGGGLCTVCDAQRFYSYRRDGTTGRMASLIWWE